MMKRACPTLVVLVALTAGAAFMAGPHRTAVQPGQDKESRPEFYVARVVSSEGVKNADEVLGKPDDRYAEVAPGGRMTLLMEKPIVSSTGFDDGMVVCKGEADYGLEGWFLAGRSDETAERAWMPLVAGMSPGGFRLSTRSFERTPEGSPGISLIRISNNGTKTLFLDAVTGYGRRS
jgi:hypothetical protein